MKTFWFELILYIDICSLCFNHNLLHILLVLADCQLNNSEGLMIIWIKVEILLILLVLRENA